MLIDTVTVYTLICGTVSDDVGKYLYLQFYSPQSPSCQ